MTINTTIRRAVLAGALTAAGVSLVAVPTTAQAAPLAARTTPAASPADPIADEAGQALVQLNQWLETGSQDALAAYTGLRASIASNVGERIDVDPARLVTAWRDADFDHQQALMAALGQVGVPYRRNTSRPGVSFDCSGLTSYAWSQAGFQLTRSSSSQIRAAAKRTSDTAQAGDLVQYPGHVMMWLGVDKAIVHAIGRGRTVEVDHSSRRSLRFGDPTGD
ncbi:MAG: C40 family peptidase [Ilumatobacteraceae bacterium]